MSAMLTELEYGYDPSRGMLAMSKTTKPLAEKPITLELAADRSWQSSGIKIADGESIIVEGNGEYVII